MNFEKLALGGILFGGFSITDFKQSDFTSRNGKFTFKIISKYIEKYAQVPTIDVLVSTITSQISNDFAPIYIGYIKSLKSVKDTPLEAIITGLRDSKAVKTLDAKIEELVELSQSREIGAAKKLLEELLVALTDTEVNAEEAKDIEYSVDNLKLLDCFLTDVKNPLQGLVLISGKSGQGKSIWALNQALHSYEQGHDILYMNLELGKNEQMARMLSCAFEKPFSEIYTQLSEDELVQINQKRKEYFSKPNKFKMVNTTLDAEFILQSIRNEVKTGLDLVVVDYLQIVKNDTSGEKWKFLENFVQDLHRLSLELGIVILTPIQVNATDIKEKNGEVSVTPRGSKELEFSSSLFFHIMQDAEEYKDSIARLITIKARQSQKHTYIMETDFEHMKFKNTGLVM